MANFSIQLRRLLDHAIESHKKRHPEIVEEIQPDDFDTGDAYVLARRDRDRAIAYPIIVQTIAAILKPGTCVDVDIRIAAAEYLNSYWQDLDQTEKLVKALIHGLFDTDLKVNRMSVKCLGNIGRVGASAIKALKTIERSSGDSALRVTAQIALKQIATTAGQP